MEINIVNATPQHLTGILNIVNAAILNTTAIYDYDARSYQDMETWLLAKRLNILENVHVVKVCLLCKFNQLLKKEKCF